MIEAQIAELRRVFGEPLEPESWHDGKVLRLLDERETLLAALRKVEWSRRSEAEPESAYCPACGAWDGDENGHADDCDLAAAIAKAEAP